MRIEQIMTRFPRTCRPDHTLAHAARLMLENDCGCLPVTTCTGSGRLVGIITDRDVCMAAQSQKKPLSELQVDEVMERRVYTCNPGDAFAQAQATMWEERVRRLPVVNELRQVVGLLSLTDLAREATREQPPGQREITKAEICELLATISDPHNKA